ncbi:MAG TPA: lasso peptide biosynthesis B2 protein [Polyangium sp.]|nr:lasso peptide biosynthesis B2 protein [Polyangium sp.]
MMNPTALLSPISSVAKAFELRIRLMHRVPRESLPRILEELTPHFLPRVTMSASRIWYVIRFEEAVCRRTRVLPDTCLYRALTRYALLRRAGYAAKFVMGMDLRAREDLTAHAWVELDGAPYHETLDARFVVTYVYPDDPSTTTAKHCPP